MVTRDITIITIVGLITVIAIIALRPKEDNTQMIIMILGFLTPTLTSLIALNRSADNRQSIKNLHKDIQNNQIEVLNAVSKDKTPNA